MATPRSRIGRVKVTPIFNYNGIALDELAQVNPDVTRSTRESPHLLPRTGGVVR